MSGLLIFTIVHVLISLVGIASGFVVALGLLKDKYCRKSTAVFLATTILTSVTGFFFPFHGFTPAHAVGIVSLLVLALACLALYRRQLAGRWRAVYVVSAMISQYLNVFVLVV